MDTRFSKTAALISSGLLAFTLTACGADDTSPAPEEPTEEQFDEFEDEPAPDTQNEEDLQDDTEPGTDSDPTDTG